MTGHTWKIVDYDDSGDVETFAYESGYHNGPECIVCGFYFCTHCDKEGWNTECGAVAPIPGQASKLDAGIIGMDAAIRAQVGLPQMPLEG